MADENKALIASSEFDPAQFISGLDAMIASMQKMTAEEEKLQASLNETNNSLKTNKAELKAVDDQIKALDKTSKTYADDLAKLNAQQVQLRTQNKELRDGMKAQKTELEQINKVANTYKQSLTQLGDISRQIAKENKGRGLFDVAALNAQVQEISRAGGQLRNVFQGKIDDTELAQFEERIAQTDDEMKRLAETIDFIKPKLESLDPNSQEFADLNRVVQVGEEVLAEYGKVTDEVGKKSGSLRSQLRALRDELAIMEDQGKDNTEEFEQMQIAAGRLQDQIGDTQQRIKVLSSDTKNLDFGIGVIRGVASAYGIAEGAAALFGVKNEDVMESIQRLNSIMLILNGLQEIQNLLQKQSIVTIVGQSIATKAAAAAQAIFATVVGTSTGALRAFRVALLATGIGAFVVLLGLAVEAFLAFSDGSEDSEAATERFTNALERQNDVLDRNTKSIEQAGQLRREMLRRQGATEAQIFEDQQNEIQEKINVLNQNIATLEEQGNDERNKLSQEGNDKRVEQIRDYIDQVQELQFQSLLNETKREADAAEAARKKQQDNQKKSIELYADYLDRLGELRRELRDKILGAQPQDEVAIRQGFANALSDALLQLDNDVKEGKLTKGRANVLRNLIRQINTVDLQQGLKEFKEANEKAETELARNLFDLRMKAANERAELLRDQFTREAAIIQEQSKETEEGLRRELADMIRGINETQEQGLISPEAARENVALISQIYGDLIDNLFEQTARKQEELTFRIFEATQQDLQRTFASIAVNVSEAFTDEILAVTERFTSGQINYEKYQKEITEIARRESQLRIATQISENEALLAGVQARLAAEQDPERIKQLNDQITQLRNTITQLRRQQAEGEADAENAETEGLARRVQVWAQYAQAIGGIVSQVAQFWNQANEAEQRSLQRSITLQEQRVEAATKIAERGNAEYLRLEEDRLNELRVKQENAARRQLAINAVLQTSQALTAFVSALAQGIAAGGPLGGIAIATAVIGLIASGYAIVSSLQKNVPQNFWEGTKSVRRKGEPAGRDTVPAMLTEGEAVIPVRQNKEYAPAVAAIYDRAVPAHELNEFVNSYRVNRRVLPVLDHNRLSDVGDFVAGFNSQIMASNEKQSEKLEENNNLLRRVHKALLKMGVNVNVDERGLAISVMNAVENEKIARKA